LHNLKSEFGKEKLPPGIPFKSRIVILKNTAICDFKKTQNLSNGCDPANNY